MLGNVTLFCILLAGCTTIQAPRLVIHGFVTLEDGQRRGALRAALQWNTVPRPVPPSIEPLPPAWPTHLGGRLQCNDGQLCAWERRSRRLAAERMTR